MHVCFMMTFVTSLDLILVLEGGKEQRVKNCEDELVQKPPLLSLVLVTLTMEHTTCANL